MENLWAQLNKQIPDYFAEIINKFQLKIVENTEIETALAGKNFAIIITLDRFYAEIDYVHRNENGLKKYRCSSFFAEKYSQEDREDLLAEESAKEIIINNFVVISRGLVSKWQEVLEGKTEWLEQYRKSEWASISNLRDFEVDKLHQYF